MRERGSGLASQRKEDAISDEVIICTREKKKWKNYLKDVKTQESRKN